METRAERFKRLDQKPFHKLSEDDQVFVADYIHNMERDETTKIYNQLMKRNPYETILDFELRLRKIESKLGL